MAKFKAEIVVAGEVEYTVRSESLSVVQEFVESFQSDGVFTMYEYSSVISRMVRADGVKRILFQKY